MMVNPLSSVIPAEATDVETLSQLIADAFHDLAPSQWLIADPDVRRKIFPGYFRFVVEQALASGIIHTTPQRTAAALWLPVAADAREQPPDYATLPTGMAGFAVERLQLFDTTLAHHHPTSIPHHHLAILAVRPDQQGRGIGAELLRAHHYTLDHDLNSPAYLEAADERTRRLYLRHGYMDLGIPIRLPGGPSMFPMWREPLATR